MRPRGSINPFDSWPDFDNQSIPVDRLKWICDQQFGSRAMGQMWVPTLLTSRPAFLSTLTISTSHNDIMSREFGTVGWPPRTESRERVLVRGEVLRMIQECLDDERLRLADATVISVIHLLASEIMSCDERAILVHRNGLLKLIQQRGGLQRLGANGSIAGDAHTTAHVKIRDALKRTDMTDCWGKLTGVLLWICLVAGAAAGPGEGEDLEAQQFIAAVLVRCFCLLAFQYGRSLTKTVKLMARIQAKLAQWRWDGRLVHAPADYGASTGPLYAPIRYRDFIGPFYAPMDYRTFPGPLFAPADSNIFEPNGSGEAAGSTRVSSEGRDDKYTTTTAGDYAK
ncbi:hypothetical protein K470DRAFT_248603 [Piedraia hortae CBS 480.64]|uniref:Transcription factor domain-containing protein n=1 Tax=Piedraia hortae CBS 480.64 TaxID=1314780 RepID=A0A6A7BX75_9PEZI|nr:hypothetical protein K470DRAFT_248603 [Piedraia hortae CBS 480.64]